jgi:hypothetical protein
MNRSMMIGGMLALGLATASPAANGQNPDAPGANDRDRTTQVDRQRAGPEFKVVFWYGRADPAATLKSKVYDLRQGRYDQRVVEGWLKEMKDKFPAYEAFERAIDLGSLPGATEEEKLAAAIRRERDQIVGAPGPREERRPDQPRQDEPGRARGGLRARPQEEGRLVQPHQTTQAPREQEQARSQPAYQQPDLSKLLHPGGTPSVRGFSSGNGFGPSSYGGSPGAGRSSLSSPSPPFPHPYPYSRPHP